MLASDIAITAGRYHSLALRADGTVWAWGQDTNGQLGNNSTTNSALPIQVSGLSRVIGIAAGAYHSLAVDRDNNVWGWGANASGQLGDGTTNQALVPVQTLAPGTTTALAGGHDHSVAAQDDGNMKTWGSGTYGQLGNGTLLSAASTPVAVNSFGSVQPLTATYSYDGDSLRASKTTAGATTAYTWDVAEGLPLLLKEATTSYVYGPGGRPLERIDASGNVLYYHHDQLGSTRMLTDSAGNIAATYTFDAYGRPASSTGSVTQPFGYAGEYTDPETGLQYLRARYYDPSTGQFLTRDPIEAVTRSAYVTSARIR